MTWKNVIKRDSPLTDVNMIKEHLNSVLGSEKKSTLENIGSGGFEEKAGGNIVYTVDVDDYDAKVDTFEKRVFEGSGDVTFTWARTREGEERELNKKTVKGTFTIRGRIKAPFEGRSNFSEKDIVLGRMTLNADIGADTSEIKQYFSTDGRIQNEVLRVIRRVYEDALYNYFRYYIEDIDVKARSKNFEPRIYGYKGEREKNPRRSKQGKWQNVIAEASPDDDREYKRAMDSENNRVLGLTKKKAEQLVEPNMKAGHARYQLYGEFPMGIGEVRYTIEEVYDKEHEKSGLFINDGEVEYYQNLYASFHHPDKQLNKKERRQFAEELRAFMDMPAERIYDMIRRNEGK